MSVKIKYRLLCTQYTLSLNPASSNVVKQSKTKLPTTMPQQWKRNSILNAMQIFLNLYCIQIVSSFDARRYDKKNSEMSRGNHSSEKTHSCLLCPFLLSFIVTQATNVWNQSLLNDFLADIQSLHLFCQDQSRGMKRGLDLCIYRVFQ